MFQGSWVLWCPLSCLPRFCSHCLQEPAVASIASRGCPDHFPPLHLQMCPSLCSAHQIYRSSFFIQRALFRARVSHVPCILFLVDWLISKLWGATSLHPPPPLPITATILSVKWMLGTRTLVFMLAQQELSTKSHLSSPPFTF